MDWNTALNIGLGLGGMIAGAILGPLLKDQMAKRRAPAGRDEFKKAADEARKQK